MNDYDTWLVRPHLEDMEDSDRYAAWCEDYAWDPDSPDAYDAYVTWLDDQFDFDYDDYDDDGDL